MLQRRLKVTLTATVAILGLLGCIDKMSSPTTESKTRANVRPDCVGCQLVDLTRGSGAYECFFFASPVYGFYGSNYVYTWDVYGAGTGNPWQVDTGIAPI